MTLVKRISCHVQEGAIYQHFVNTHNHPPVRKSLIDSIEIAAISGDHKDLPFTYIGDAVVASRKAPKCQT